MTEGCGLMCRCFIKITIQKCKCQTGRGHYTSTIKSVAKKKLQGNSPKSENMITWLGLVLRDRQDLALTERTISP